MREKSAKVDDILTGWADCPSLVDVEWKKEKSILLPLIEIKMNVRQYVWSQDSKAAKKSIRPMVISHVWPALYLRLTSYQNLLNFLENPLNPADPDRFFGSSKVG